VGHRGGEGRHDPGALDLPDPEGVGSHGVTTIIGQRVNIASRSGDAG
jgi:hypothetical protein